MFQYFLETTIIVLKYTGHGVSLNPPNHGLISCWECRAHLKMVSECISNKERGACEVLLSSSILYVQVFFHHKLPSAQIWWTGSQSFSVAGWTGTVCASAAALTGGIKHCSSADSPQPVADEKPVLKLWGEKNTYFTERGVKSWRAEDEVEGMRTSSETQWY